MYFLLKYKQKSNILYNIEVIDLLFSMKNSLIVRCFLMFSQNEINKKNIRQKPKTN